MPYELDTQSRSTEIFNHTNKSTDVLKIRLCQALGQIFIIFLRKQGCPLLKKGQVRGQSFEQV